MNRIDTKELIVRSLVKFLHIPVGKYLRIGTGNVVEGVTAPLGIESVTYEQLMVLIGAELLVKGTSYSISDYQTVHTIPETTDTNTGDVEPLIVTAISSSELKPEAYSLLYPDDIIYYSHDNDQEKVPGCTKGYIYRRIDTKQNNDIPFDFRQVKFRRWQISQPTYSASTTYTKGTVVKSDVDDTLWMSLKNANTGNTLEEGPNWRQFEWNNNDYVAWSPDAFPSADVDWFLTPNANYQDYKMWANDADYLTAFGNKIKGTGQPLMWNNVIFGEGFVGNEIGIGFDKNSISDGFAFNHIMNNFSNNSIGYSFSKNFIGNDFNGNSIGAYCEGNNIGAYCVGNSIGDNFSSNTIGASFITNVIGASFSSNTIGDNFTGNSIVAYFCNNTIGASFIDNVIGTSFIANNIGAYFEGNSIGASFTENTIGPNFNGNIIGSNFIHNVGSAILIDFTSATHVYRAYTCYLFSRVDGTQKLKYCDNTDTEVIVDIND